MGWRSRAARPLVLLALLLAAAPPVLASEATMRVHLLGTGGPELSPHRQGYATLIVAGEQKLLFDAGRGVMQRLYESRINPRDITTVFFTHLHNDHYEGLPPLWMTSWFLLGRERPLEAWGPPGTAGMIQGMRAMFAHDLDRRVNPFNKLKNLAISVNEIGDGPIFERDGVRVTAFTVDHKDGNPALGYRVDHAGRAVVLSGDTTYDANLVRQGKGADLIVHNVIAFSERLSRMPEMQGVLAKLTTPEQTAQVFNETAPRLAVFSHIVKKELQGAEGDREILARTRAAGYAGPLEMGQDRMTIEIGDEIRVMPPQPTDELPDLDSKTAKF
jgi:ribonuclease Z